MEDMLIDSKFFTASGTLEHPQEVLLVGLEVLQHAVEIGRDLQHDLGDDCGAELLCNGLARVELSDVAV